ncbi:MAG TPA: hypothetical protein VEX15_10845 [Nocardioidaceae bacterium]|nr:hypothetical protein [Nocardioidaceae bacterium]
MHVRFARPALALMTVLAVGLPTSVAASDADHTTVASDIPARWTPNLVANAAVGHPVAFSIAQAGDQMVVGGRFTAVENSSRTTSYARSNVFAFDADTGAVSGFAPSVNGEVWSVLGAGGSVYIGGEFTTVNGQPRAAIAKLDLATGQLDPTFRPAISRGRVTDMELTHGRLIIAGTFANKLTALNPDTGKATSYLDVAITNPLPFTTKTEVFKFDVSPDGQRLVAVGNFTAVNGQGNWRIFMLNLTDMSATVSPWIYPHASRACHAQMNPMYQMYVRDVDFAPDSSYFAVASTGGHRINGEGPGLVLCDAVARFNTADLAPTQPVWINYTGGDTLHSVAASGAAVYVQGHSRWLDNPFGRDSAGPGAVERPGGGAVDPMTGKALPWNPGMPQQMGGYQILPVDGGVWFATDGKRFNQRYHLGIRFVPLP